MSKLRHTRWQDHVLYRLVAAELRKLRKEQGIEQQRMAGVIGISAAGMARLELVHNRMSLLVFVRVCRALGRRPGEVLDRIVGWIDDADIDESERFGVPIAPREGEGSGCA